MALFKETDWVQITPNSDKSWKRWNNNSTYYDNFRNQIGQIQEIDEDPDNRSQMIYKVSVYFSQDIYDGYDYLVKGNYTAYFREKHLIRSSKYEADLRINRQKAGNDLQEWENFKKKTTDDMLRQVFCPPKKDTTDQWNLKTDPTFMPDYNSYKKSDEDVNLLDFLNPNDPDFYTND
jgi:hypothetical protein